jgi:hypothetical protein
MVGYGMAEKIEAGQAATWFREIRPLRLFLSALIKTFSCAFFPPGMPAGGLIVSVWRHSALESGSSPL